MTENELKTLLYDWTHEYRFHPVRRWRFDHANPEYKVAIEYEGGIWTGGRHTRGTGYKNDCDKYNAAQVLGWRVLRYTTSHTLEQVLADIVEIDKQLLRRPKATMEKNN